LLHAAFVSNVPPRSTDGIGVEELELDAPRCDSSGYVIGASSPELIAPQLA
jgi:hypothetical protein